MVTTVLTAILCLSADPERVELKIEGADRQALVFAPAAPPASGAPVVFVFHGHGGNMQATAKKWRIEERWPEAVVVYPQGLPTPSPVDPEGRRSGWQRMPGAHSDRDLKLFDALLAMAGKRWRVDDSRVYAAGHSNGAVFTYLLWAQRPKILAAVAPCAAPRTDAGPLTPLPVMHIAGRADRIASFSAQEKTIEEVRRVCHCSERGESWAEHCTRYPSTSGTPLVTFIHDGGHVVPDEALPLVVRFFKEHARPVAAR